MKKTLIILGIIVGVIALAVGIYYLNDYLNQPTEQEMEEAREQIEKGFQTPEKDMPEEHQLDLIEYLPNEMLEFQLQDIIHAMSHQKVKADKKWDDYMIIKERIERLLEVAEMNEDKYEWGPIYVDILSRWIEGDFSKAVEDHNAIWELQDGNVGIAYGLLNPVEEKAYLDYYFNNIEDNQE